MSSIASSDDPFDLWWQDPKSRSGRFISVKEASYLASKDENTVRFWFNSGRVPGVKVAGTIWILRTGLEDYLRGTDA